MKMGRSPKEYAQLTLLERQTLGSRINFKYSLWRTHDLASIHTFTGPTPYWGVIRNIFPNSYGSLTDDHVSYAMCG